MDRTNGIASTRIEELRVNAENAQMHHDSLVKKLKDEQLALISAKESEASEAIRLKNLEEDFCTVESKFQNAKMALDELDVDFEDLVSDLRSRSEAVETELTSAQELLETLKSDFKDAGESAKQARVDFEKEQKNEMIIALAEVQQARAEIRNNEDDKNKLAADVLELQAKIRQFEPVIEERKHKSKHFETDLKQANEEVERAIAKEIVAKRELESTQKEIANVEANIKEMGLDDIDSSISECQNALKTAKQNRRDAHSELRRVKVDLKYKKASDLDVSNAIEKLRKSDKLVTDLKSNINSLYKDKASVELKVKAKLDEIKATDKLLNQLKKELTVVEKNVHTARKKENECKSRAMKEST